jgi:hypothetical protein
MTVNRRLVKVQRPPYTDIEVRPHLYYDLKNPYDMLPCNLMKCFVMAFDRGIFKFTSPEESQVCDQHVVLCHRLISRTASINHEYWAACCA